MNYEKMCKLIDGIIENDFNKVQEFKEVEFVDKDTEQQQLNKVSSELMDKLMETLSEEQKDLLDKLDEALSSEWINLCRFYFKEGVSAGLTNLNFLNDIESVASYIR